jgi:hypothetical protein
MAKLWGDIDRLLRGELTRAENLRVGRFEAPMRSLALGAILLGAIYGSSLGLFAGMRGEHATGWQALSSALKLPLLFLLTLLVTFPSLYVFSALARSPLRATTTLKLILAAIAVTLALLASFAPVLAFFTLGTTSYPFLVLLNVLFCAVSGWIGLAFLRAALTRLFATGAAQPAEPAEQADVARDGLDLGRHVFTFWMVVYALVGAQMSWILRPFVGDPALPFAWFRPRESNFFEALFGALRVWLG